MDINNHVAVITGGASGMGLATTKKLSQLGAKVVVLDIHQDAIEAIQKELNCLGFMCDVCDENSVNAAVNKIVEQLGAIHMVVNCAGIVGSSRIVGKNGPMNLSDFEKIIQVNLIGSFNVMRLMAAQMSKQVVVNEEGERGVIIHTASIAAFDGQIGQAAYSASKGGIVSMTLPAARELASFGIRVMTIAPGVMETPMLDNISDEIKKQLSANIPFPKRLGKPEEFANLSTHIIENSYLNGEVIRLDAALRMAAK